jgi:hypothetical protein
MYLQHPRQRVADVFASHACDLVCCAAGKAVYQVEYLLPKTEDCSWCIWSYDAWKKAVCGKAQSTYGVNSILKKVDLKQQPYHSCM